MHFENEIVQNDKTLNFSLIGIAHHQGYFDTFIQSTNIWVFLYKLKCPINIFSMPGFGKCYFWNIIIMSMLMFAE